MTFDIEDLIDHMTNKTILGVDVEEGDFILLLSDGTEIIFWSQEDLNVSFNTPNGVKND